MRPLSLPLLLAALSLIAGACPHPGPQGPRPIEVALPAAPEALLRIARAALRPGARRPQFLRAVAATRRLLRISPKSFAAAWLGARACFLLGDEATASAEQARWAREGLGHARLATSLKPQRPEGHYYLALNLGLAARADNLRALKLIPRTVAAAKRAARLDPRYDRAGPLRLLGYIYTLAPPWPTSVGDREEGLALLRRAVRLAPEEPLNHLFLAECLIGEERLTEARREIRIVLAAPRQGEWARIGTRWRRHARKLLRRIRVKEHHQRD